MLFLAHSTVLTYAPLSLAVVSLIDSLISHLSLITIAFALSPLEASLMIQSCLGIKTAASPSISKLCSIDDY